MFLISLSTSFQGPASEIRLAQTVRLDKLSRQLRTGRPL